MNSTAKTLKRKTYACQSDASKPKGKIVKKTLKTRVQLNKEPEKPFKFKKEEDLSCADNQELEGEPSSKKIKLECGSEKQTAKTKNSNKSENANKKWSLWRDEDYLSQSEGISVSTARNIIGLFEKENTIPFIARYRGHLTGHLTPDKLRKIKATYDYIGLVHKKAKNLVQQVPSNELTPELESCIQSAHTLEELEFISNKAFFAYWVGEIKKNTPLHIVPVWEQGVENNLRIFNSVLPAAHPGSQFKKDSKKSLAHRSRELGLEPPAKLLLEGQVTVRLEDFVKVEVPGLEDTNNVKLGIQRIIADIISKNAGVHNVLENIYSSKEVLLNSKFKSGLSERDKASSKYYLYGDFSQRSTTIKPHQTLAINRGESENELTVKIVIPDPLWLPLKNFCNKTWLQSGSNYELRRRVFSDSVDDAIKRLLGPLAIRRIRAKLNAEAENEALSVFSINLRQLLMTPPYSGHVVMGIDPGFGNGCKVAVVSRTGELIASTKFYLNSTTQARFILKRLVSDHSCDIIALGNGTACRETENLLDNLIKRKVFKPYNVSYTIINEQGVSIYSCSPVAEEEFPNMDPQIVGAVSLARRLQNPLSELVKVEPRHLGVGMYQHDVRQKRLESTLEDIVSECVSFVGVDINSASFHLLKRVAGLNATKAQEIIKYRTENCPFMCREDLKKVKGIKTKTFQQCAGFIRVIPATARCTKHISCQREFNPLDETSIHPESYDVALKVIHRLRLPLARLGSEDFVEIMRKENQSEKVEELAKYCNCSTLEMAFIIDSLSKAKDFDLRSVCPGPIFRTGIKNLEDLHTDDILEGVVRNVVSFGAFVDVGVGQNGLIHVSRMGNNSVQLNDRVTVEVMSVSLCPQKIELRLISVLQ